MPQLYIIGIAMWTRIDCWKRKNYIFTIILRWWCYFVYDFGEEIQILWSGKIKKPEVFSCMLTGNPIWA